MKLGFRHMQQMNFWTRSLVTFGAAAGVGFVYFTEWRAITDYIPIYNTKYSEEKK